LISTKRAANDEEKRREGESHGVTREDLANLFKDHFTNSPQIKEGSDESSLHDVLDKEKAVWKHFFCFVVEMR